MPAALASRVCSSLEICLVSRGLGPLAPAHTGAVVGAHARGLCDLLLHPDLVGRHTQAASFQDHRGAAFSDAVDGQAVTANVHHFAGWGIGTLVYLRGDDLIDRAHNSEREEPGDHPHEPTPDPKTQPSPWSRSLRVPSQVLIRFARRCFALHGVVPFLPRSS